MDELKRCPCCGHKAKLLEHRFNELPPTYGVECTACSLSTWQFWGRKEDAKKAWNTRVKEGEE